VLNALLDSGGRVVDRHQLRRAAGLDELNERRCDSVLVGLRRVLGPDAVVTVRRRGWRLSPESIAAAMTIISMLG
jgi:DNA-binding response OmpR family regulator